MPDLVPAPQAPASAVTGWGPPEPTRDHRCYNSIWTQ